MKDAEIVRDGNKIYFDGHTFYYEKRKSQYRMGGGFGKSKKRRMSLNRYIWEYFNGPIPVGGVIMHKDGDRENFDKNNLVLIDTFSDFAYINSTRNRLGYIETVQKSLKEASEKRKNSFPIICDFCGKEFTILPYRFKKAKSHYCSRACRVEASKRTVVKKCEVCGNEFLTNQSLLTVRKFCSPTCACKGRIYKNPIESNVKGSNRIANICAICGKEFLTIPSVGKQKTCSKKCANEYATEKITFKCLNCHGEYKKYKSTKNSKFCSWKCRNEYHSKKNNCIVCGKEIKRYISEYRGDDIIQYCSIECAEIDMENRTNKH